MSGRDALRDKKSVAEIVSDEKYECPVKLLAVGLFKIINKNKTANKYICLRLLSLVHLLVPYVTYSYRKVCVF